MKFGIFDYVDFRDEPLTRTYDDRMKLLLEAEAAGFYSYHVTEHHVTPLSGTPSPSVFLAAVARETTRLRLGALLFLLPLYHPLRLLEELYMLDNLSHGRLDVGAGKGVSPFEFAAFGADLKESEAAFEEAFAILHEGLTRDRLNYKGKRYQFNNVPMVMKSVQKPHPPLWYGLRGGPSGSLLPARYGMHVVTLGTDEKAEQAIKRFREAWTEYAPERAKIGSPVTDPIIGMVRGIVIADTDAEAERIARPAYQHWFDNVCWLWKHNRAYPTIPLSEDYDESCRTGTMVVGNPDTVRRILLQQSRRCGNNYLVLKLAFGNLTHAQEMRTLKLFVDEVMPAIQLEAPELAFDAA